MSLLLCFLALEIFLRFFGPQAYLCPNVSFAYYTNPRGYFDLIGRDSDGRSLYGIPLQRESLDEGMLPFVRIPTRAWGVVVVLA